MRWARYQSPDGPRFALVEADALVDVDGTPFGEWHRSGRTLPLGATRLLPPVEPRNFFAVGYNYAAHTREAEGFLDRKLPTPKQPDVGSRFVSSVVGPEDPIVIPADSSGVVQFEGELVAVIGRAGRHLSEAEVPDHILGFTVGNDVSERGWQKTDGTVWRAKSADSFCPMGPWIETSVDLDTLETRIRLNGAEVSRFATNGMIFGVAAYLSRISRYITLMPGDMIWMGAEAPSLDMRAGDVVEVEITGIGTLRNPVVAGPQLPE